MPELKDPAGPAGPEEPEEPEEAAVPTTRHDVVAFLVVGLLGLVLLAVAVAALVLPPGIAFTLIRRGLGEDRPSWVVLGGVAAALWVLFLYLSAKRLLHRGRGAAPGG